MTVGDRIKMIRKKNGLKQIDFAKRVLVTSSYISKVESNKEMPSEIFIKLTALEFNVPYDWLRDGVGNINIEQNQHDYFERTANNKSTYKELEALYKSIYSQTQGNNTFRFMCMSDMCDNMSKLIDLKMGDSQKDLLFEILADYIGNIEELTEKFISIYSEKDYNEKCDFYISSYMKCVEKNFTNMKRLIKEQ